jgi:hypothetical protein
VRILAAIPILLASGAALAAPASQPAAIDTRAIAALRAIQHEPETSKLIFNQHFVISNELRQYVYRRAITGATPRGGLFVGVGAEQNYILGAWYRSDVIAILDFDPWIADLHAIYSLLFRRASTPQEFLRLWPSRREVEAAIEADVPAGPVRQQRIRVYRFAREKVSQRLREIAKDYPKGSETFLTDQAQYDHLVALAKSGRIRALQADFCGERTLKQLAAWAQRFRVPLRVLYLSNIEWYFPYTQGRYRQNILDFPLGEPSLVLHTSPIAKDRYMYVFQSGATYREWLRCQCVPSLKSLLNHGRWLNEHVIQVSKRPSDLPPRPKAKAP